jgi:hypothetical protein
VVRWHVQLMALCVAPEKGERFAHHPQIYDVGEAAAVVTLNPMPL